MPNPYSNRNRNGKSFPPWAAGLFPYTASAVHPPALPPISQPAVEALAKQVERIPSGFVSVHSKAVPLGRVHLPGAGAANHLFRVALSNHDHLIGRKLD